MFLVKVIDNDSGMNMRPLPGMVGLVPSGSKVQCSTSFDLYFHYAFLLMTMIRSACFLVQCDMVLES